MQYQSKIDAQELEHKTLEESYCKLQKNFDKMKELHENQDGEKEAKIDILKNEIEGLQDKLKNTIESLQGNHAESLESLKQEHEKYVSDLKADKEKGLQELETLVNSKIT